MRSLLTKGICLALALSAAGTAQAGKKESQHRKRLHKLMIVTLTRSFRMVAPLSFYTGYFSIS